jgi:putative DNA primase/helicase
LPITPYFGFYGAAGRAFIEWLLKNRASAIAIAQDKIEQFERDNAEKIEDDPQMGRVAGRFGLLYAALILAVKAGVLPWQECSCADAVDACFSAWLGQRGHSGGHEAVRAIELIDGFLTAQDARFEKWEEAPTHPIRDRAGFKKVECNQGTPRRPVKITYYILPAAFGEACRPHDPVSVARHLKEAGRLIPGSSGFQRNERLPRGTPKQSVYVVVVAVAPGETQALLPLS